MLNPAELEPILHMKSWELHRTFKTAYTPNSLWHSATFNTRPLFDLVLLRVSDIPEELRASLSYTSTTIPVTLSKVQYKYPI